MINRFYLVNNMKFERIITLKLNFTYCTDTKYNLNETAMIHIKEKITQHTHTRLMRGATISNVLIPTSGKGNEIPRE